MTMSGKKNKCLERLKNQSSSSYECMLYKYHDAATDEFIQAKYSNNCFRVLHNICAVSANEHYGDYDTEHFWNFDEENTKKLMLRTGSHDGESLIKSVKMRFGQYGSHAAKRIEEYCKKNEIEYKESIY